MSLEPLFKNFKPKDYFMLGKIYLFCFFVGVILNIHILALISGVGAFCTFGTFIVKKSQEEEKETKK